MQEIWQKSIRTLKGVGPARCNSLHKLKIFTLGDVLMMFPRQDKYQDRTKLKKICELKSGEIETFYASIISMSERNVRRGLDITKLIVADDTGNAEIIWFNQSYQLRKYKVGMKIIVSGKVERKFGIQITKPEIDIEDSAEIENYRCLMPTYALADKLTQQFMRSLVRQALEYIPYITENLPESIINKYNLVSRNKALYNIHFPTNREDLRKAQHRFIFEELYFLQCGLLSLKAKNRQYKGIKHSADGELTKKVMTILPFELTTDQRKALDDVKKDMEDIQPMQRLIQGDVGSGKTVIAALALVKTIENGFQGAMMAPTEILADQHYHTLASLLAPLGVRIVILKGSLTKSVREKVLDRIKEGLVDIVVGTHALLQEDVVFKQLGLVVTDEQHRFGVQQRAKLQAKGNSPDVLVMTATPIPRTMALTVYGDLDVSVIREMPPGRKPIITRKYSTAKRSLVYEGVLRQIAQGRQVYVVCPLVDESENINAESAVETYERLKNTYFRNVECGLVHGKMSQQEKDEVMAAYAAGKIKLLVATTIIEVGVNVPNATIMVIEGADRFGLAQLHQLRGRVGRGEHQSYCVLISDNNNEETRQRLEYMTKYNDGFILAEKDLELRGPGQFFGTRQHGLPDLKLANIIRDLDILLEARQAAVETLQDYGGCPDIIIKELKDKYGERFRMIYNS